MGFLSRFSTKKELDTVQDLEKELESAVKSAQAEFIALVGIKGKLKGLEIVNAIKKDSVVNLPKLKRYVAKLVELYLRLETLQLISQDARNKLQYFQLYYAEQVNFCLIPILGNDKFIIVAMASNISKVLKSLEREKVNDKLNQLFPPKSSDFEESSIA
ncbi:MAG: hypothetical protein RBG13Loki_3877 [Promethearchaeota archaeon CR_4]|nr:MAG: hypothetical protein RBG13Loki_3877 [Candidatus Lokiarchaeota archaeon CR_4]